MEIVPPQRDPALAVRIWKLIGNLKFEIRTSFFLLLPAIALAQDKLDCGEDASNQLCNPLAKNVTTMTPLLEILGSALQAALGLAGAIAFVVIILGAAQWMMAGGNSERVTKGKDMMVWAFLGLILAAASFVVVNFIFKGLRTALFTP